MQFMYYGFFIYLLKVSSNPDHQLYSFQTFEPSNPLQIFLFLHSRPVFSIILELRSWSGQSGSLFEACKFS